MRNFNTNSKDQFMNDIQKSFFTKCLSYSFQVVLMLIIVLGISSSLYAQEIPGDIQYRFYVRDISTRESAKMVQYQMLQDTSIHSCTYIHLCECFKINTPLTLNRAQLSSILEGIGHELTGVLYCGDGRVLQPPSISTQDR